MARQGYREISIEVPEDWQDRSVLAFSAPPRPGKASQPSVVVTREDLPSGMTARTFAAKQLAASARGLPDFELEDSREIAVAGQPGVDMRFTWSADRGPIAQRQVVVAVGSVVYTMTYSCARSEMAPSMPAFDAMLQTMRFGPVPNTEAVSSVASGIRSSAPAPPPAPSPTTQSPPAPPPVFRRNPF